MTTIDTTANIQPGEDVRAYIVEMLEATIRNADICIRSFENADDRGAEYSMRRMLASVRAGRGAMRLLRDTTPGDKVPDPVRDSLKEAA